LEACLLLFSFWDFFGSDFKVQGFEFYDYSLFSSGVFRVWFGLILFF